MDDLIEKLYDFAHQSGCYELGGFLYDREGNFVDTVENWEKEENLKVE